MTPKISVLIPMYNRKHYIEQCIGSVLNQTFQDFEIIVRDDGSKDGSADFVAQRYAAEISAGKIKLRRNEKNLGENPNVIKLILDSTGKYFAVLHSDDMYLPHALEHLYTVAEKSNADVVHAIRFLMSPPGGVINANTSFRLIAPEKQTVNKAAVMPDDQFWRFTEFVNSSVFFGDTQHSFFKREFIFDNRILIDTRCNPLWWLLLAKVYVKTPEVYYIWRNAPDSKSNSTSTNNASLYPIERIEEAIDTFIERARVFDKYAPKFKIFREHPEFADVVKARFFNVMTNCMVRTKNFYRKDSVPPQVRQAVEKAFKKHLGENASYPIFLFHLINFLPHIPNFERVFLQPPPRSFKVDLILTAA